MCYNDDGQKLPAEGCLTPNEKEALRRCAQWQHKFETERAAHQGTWAYMEKYDAMLKTLRLIMDDPCDGCRWLDRCPGECPVFDRVRDVLYGRNG